MAKRRPKKVEQVENGSSVGNEDNNSNQLSREEVTNVEVHDESNNSLDRRSDRLKRKREPIVRLNLVESPRKKASVGQVSKSAAPAEITVHVESETKPVEPKKKTSNRQQVSATGRNLKEEAPQAVDERVTKLVEPKKKTSKCQQVTTTGRNTKKDAPQVVDERNLVQVGNRSLKSSALTDYESLYFASQIRVEELMASNLELVKELSFARGKVDAYEKMAAVMGVTLRIPQRCIPSTSGGGGGAAAPEDDTNDPKISPPKGKRKYQKATPDGTGRPKVASPMRNCRNAKKNGEA